MESHIARIYDWVLVKERYILAIPRTKYLDHSFVQRINLSKKLCIMSWILGDKEWGRIRLARKLSKRIEHS